MEKDKTNCIIISKTWTTGSGPRQPKSYKTLLTCLQAHELTG